jgi:hypothetical protein
MGTDEAGSSGAVASSGGGSGAASGGAGFRDDFTCNLFMGVSATQEWIVGGGFDTLVDGTKWESICKANEYIFKWPMDPAVWTQPFDGGHACAKNSTSPDRVVFTAYTGTNTAMFNDFAMPNDPMVVANWVTALENVVMAIQMHYPMVKRIEFTGMIRGPSPNGGTGTDCDKTATLTGKSADAHEDIVMPWIDAAIATVSQHHPGLVVAAPKFYIGDCTWYAGVGAHYAGGGKPAMVAQVVANWYKSGICMAPTCAM